MRRSPPPHRHHPTLPGAAFAAVLAAGAAAAATGPPDAPSGLAEARGAAEVLLRDGRYEAALSAYREIVRHTPDDPQSHYELAATYAFLRMYHDAVDAIEAAVALAPHEIRYLRLAALVYFQLDDDANAFRISLAAAEHGDPQAMFTLVGLYRRGQGVPASTERAVGWAERAADAGHLGAMAWLATAHGEGRHGLSVDTGRARYWAGRLAEAERAFE